MVKSHKFPVTRWSLIITFQQGDEAEATLALEDLCRTYWYPLYAHARRSKHSPEEAEDLTQAFFHHLISRDALHKIRIDGRKLRSYLLKSLNHFMSASTRHDRALKRGGGRPIIDIDGAEAENLYRSDICDHDDPGLLYERRWALTMMRQVLKLLREEFEGKGKLEKFEVLQEMLLPGAQERSHRELAELLGTTEATARVTLFRARQRYGELLREAIAETVPSASEVDEEIAHLINVLRKS